MDNPEGNIVISEAQRSLGAESGEQTLRLGNEADAERGSWQPK